MTTDAVGAKSDGISKMNNAVLGLLLAFGIYIILNTINPNILNLDPGIRSITLTADERNFEKTEVSRAVSGTYKLKGTHENPQPSPGVSTFVNHIKNDNYVLEKITINTQQKQATFPAKKGSSGKQVTIPINIGLSGVSQIGQASFGDNKTPKGTTLTEIDRNPFLSPSTDKPIFTRDGKTNLGAAFINIGATINNTNRGIGFHGHANNTLSQTNGCVRMYNDDLLVLGPYMGKNGIQVIIQ
jgi:lipoprotein-anchoring transpeptidase ErfK/SrfK